MLVELICRVVALCIVCSGADFSPCWGHRVLFLGETLTPSRGACHYTKRFWKFRSEFKWKVPFSVSPDRNIRHHLWRWSTCFGSKFRPKCAVPFLTNRFFTLVREFKKGIKSSKGYSYWLARFNRKMSFHFPRVFTLVSDRPVWHNGSTPGI